jgi:hypothetical protein
MEESTRKVKRRNSCAAAKSIKAGEKCDMPRGTKKVEARGRKGAKKRKRKIPALCWLHHHVNITRRANSEVNPIAYPLK